MFRTHGELEAHITMLQAQMKAAAANLEFEKAATTARQASSSSARRTRAGREPELMNNWIKAALLEVQEYARMVGKAARRW